MADATAGCVKGYCEHSSHREWLRALQRSGGIALVHFPYDPKSFNEHNDGPAMPSGARYYEANIPYNKAGNLRYCDFTRSDKFDAIVAIVGKANRRDALHIDSAYKSGCRFFLTTDKTDILRNRNPLFALLGIRFFHPDDDRAEMEGFLGSSSPAPLRK